MCYDKLAQRNDDFTDAHGSKELPSLKFHLEKNCGVKVNIVSREQNKRLYLG